MFEKLKGRLQHNRKSVKPSLEARTLYVNLEIPPEELDDFGQPRQYLSNRINTAKYTWYTFLPKNLFEQFRGIANLYFLFLVILQMFPLFSTSASPVLVVLPLAAILILTGAKDAVEDNKRHQTDESVNKAITYSLSDWKNVNVPVYKVSRWKRIINKIKSVFINKNKNELERTNSQMSHLEATKARSFRESLRSSTGSFSRVFLKKKRGMPYRPGQVPHSVLRRSHLPTEKEKKKRHSTARQPLDKRWRKTLWEDIKVGDLVCLRNDDPIPADMAVLSSSEPEGLCYVETQNLDGETNLKIKRSLQATNEIRSPDDCDTCQFYVESESPNPNLYSYNGVLKWKIDIQPSNSWDDLDPIRENNSMDDDDSEEVLHEKSEAITGNSVLLRGCVLRNTGWVIGMVLFTGNETKIMLNSGKTPSKRSKMEKQTNPYVSKQTNKATNKLAYIFLLFFY
jgi:phospholipid-translocating ATPase